MIAASAAFISVQNIILTPDSISYALASQQILSGNGISVPLIRITDNDVPVNGLVPLIMYPPLLPIFLAVLGGVTPQSFLAAQILNVISHVLIAVFTFMLVNHLCGKVPAFLAGLLVSLSFPLMNVTHYLWSETLFIALTVAALYLSAVSRDNGVYQTRYLLIAGICSSAAIITRYAGIALIGMLFWNALVIVKNRKTKLSYLSVILSVIIPALTVAAVFTYNYMVSGSLRGYNPPIIERTYIAAFIGTINMLLMQFTSSRPISIIAAFLIFYTFFNPALRREMLKLFNSGMDLIIVFIIAYTAIIGVSMAKSQPNFELRYMSPLVPMLLIISFSFILPIVNELKYKVGIITSRCGLVLAMGILTYTSCYKTIMNLPEFFAKNDRIYSILDSCTFNWTINNYGKDIIIATNNPFNLSFFGEYSTVLLPRERWFIKNYPNEDIESALANSLSGVKAQVLVLFNEVNVHYYGKYLDQLINNRADRDKFTLANECSDGVVYLLRHHP